MFRVDTKNIILRFCKYIGWAKKRCPPYLAKNLNIEYLLLYCPAWAQKTCAHPYSWFYRLV